MPFDLGAPLREVALGHEAPVEGADDPVLQPLHVERDVAVQARAERGQLPLVFGEVVDGLPAELTDAVYGLLEGESAEVHEDDDHLRG